MKTSKYLEELNTQSAADLKMQLVEAKKSYLLKQANRQS